MRIVLELLLWSSLAAPLALHAQQPAPITSDGAECESDQTANSATPCEESQGESNPAITIKPEWTFSSDSLGNIRQRIQLGNDYAVGNGVRLGLLYGQGYVYDAQLKSSRETEAIRDAGVTAQWRPNEVLKVQGMFGVWQTGATLGTDQQTVPQAIIPITNVLASLSPAGDMVKLDFGFKRSFFDLSPQLVANRVVRNDLVLHPQIGLSSGWRFRELAEIGPVTRPGESNYRYNSESTVARKLAKNSEVYSTFATLHYAEQSHAGYFCPDLAQNIEGGWSTDIDRKALSLSLDFGLGASHARQHGETFGPWGISGHAETDVTWKIRHRHELHATYEFYYDQSTPPLESAQAGPWHMTILTVSFRWSR